MLAVVAGAVACRSTATDSGQAVGDNKAATVDVYVGKLPAADGPGVIYELAIEKDSLYVLKTTYIEAVDGRDTTFVSKGRVEKDYVEAEYPRGSYELLKLEEGNEIIHFEVINDSTLCLLNENRDLPENESLYYIHKSK